jgi:hypothetical protein
MPPRQKAILRGIARKNSSTMLLTRQGEAAMSNRTPCDDLQFAFPSDEQVAALAESIDTAGFGVLEDAVSDCVVDQSRHYVEDQLFQRGGQYFGLAGHEWIEESPLAPLARSPQLEDVLKKLYHHAMGELPPQRPPTPSLRVLAGTVGLRHSYLFHYDSYVVTALVPLLIPHEAGELPGDLLLYPNMRRIRHSAIVNILEKMLVENSLACRAWRTSWMRRRFGARVVKMKPGSIYFFWGIRSLHANEACLVTSIRSTALFHYGDPHAGSFLKRLSARRHLARLRRLNRGTN